MFFDDVWKVRARSDETLAVRSFLHKNEKYTSFSHFVRTAVMKAIREEKKV